MRIVAVVLLVFLSVGFVVFGASSALARTRNRTPTPTLGPLPTSTPTPTRTPWPTPTPTLPPEQVSRFSGTVWLDHFGGYDKAGPVTAKIGEAVCGEESLCLNPPCLRIPVDPQPLTHDYHLDVLRDTEKPGCGYEGAPITFYINDKKANETAVWHASGMQTINLTSGPPFALLTGSFTFAFEPEEYVGVTRPAGIIALVGDEVCGQAVHGIWRGRMVDGQYPYGFIVVVKSNEEQAGCGVEGSEVTFQVVVNRQEGNVCDGQAIAVARQTGIWHAWNGESPHEGKLRLTMVPIGISVGNVGTGRPTDATSSNWARISSIALLALGAAGTMAGLVMRRQARR